MKVFNIRRGHACNSSSSHSVVLFKDSSKIEDDFEVEYGFGWDYFTLASREAKALYVKAQIGSNINSKFNYASADNRRLMAKYLIPPNLTVDHQSVINLPMNWQETDFDQCFLDEFTSVMTRDDVVILGGNDNDGSPHRLESSSDGEFKIRYSDNRYHRWSDAVLRGMNAVARNDGDYYTVYDRKSGDKARMSFKNIPAPKCSKAPELVDIKVTDYCDYGCAYCYQGSTKRGKHADLKYLKSVIDELAEVQVFEIAFGGGEPTDHPDFLDVLKYTASKLITPNFTTRNVKWLIDNYDELLAIVGSIAVSVDTAAEMNSYQNLLTAAAATRATKLKVIYQVVIGAVTTEELSAMYAVSSQITLLGWKDNNRGATATKVECDWKEALLSRTKDSKYQPDMKSVLQYGLRVDTKFINDFKAELDTLNVDPLSVGPGEGTFSCYIDAVSKQIAPSSYCGHEDYHQFDKIDLAEKWKMITERSTK